MKRIIPPNCWTPNILYPCFITWVPILFYSPSVAVVGTRHPTEQGIRRTQQLVKELVQDNYTVVSGLAKGIDTAAHETAIAHGGKTIAVIGTSILDYYPPENRALQDKIATEYLVVSQVPLLTVQTTKLSRKSLLFSRKK